VPRIVKGAVFERAEVVKLSRGGDSRFRVLRLRAPGLSAAARPGQFLMLRATDESDPLLARPFAVFDLPGERPGEVEVLFDIVGRGTALMDSLEPGDSVQVLGPLGEGWRYEDLGGKTAVLVAGGCGVAALFLLARRLLERGSCPVVLIDGARSKDALMAGELRGRLAGARIELATEDGSAGFRGTAVELAGRLLDKEPATMGACALFAAGPRGMLKAMHELAESRGLPLQVSMEERMACGVGVCRGCVVRARTPHPETGLSTRSVCADGPVFDSRELDWGSV
jgi:dihydroorotate dehydrogenase electron transfer subunit